MLTHHGLDPRARHVGADVEHHLVGDVAGLAHRRDAGEPALAEIRPDRHLRPRHEIHPAVIQQRAAEVVRFGQAAAEVEPLQSRPRVVGAAHRAACIARIEPAARVVRGVQPAARIAWIEPPA